MNAKTANAASEESFKDWLKTAPPGQAFEYYKGFLLADRVHWEDFFYTEGEDPVRMLVDTPAISRVANLAMAASDDRLVNLVQVKLAEGMYSYLALKRRPPSAREKERPGVIEGDRSPPYGGHISRPRYSRHAPLDPGVD